jgi:hypothetical protein
MCHRPPPPRFPPSLPHSHTHTLPPVHVAQVRRLRSVSLEAAMAMDTPLPQRVSSMRWRSSAKKGAPSAARAGRVAQHPTPGHGAGQGSVVLAARPRSSQDKRVAPAELAPPAPNSDPDSAQRIQIMNW